MPANQIRSPVTLRGRLRNSGSSEASRLRLMLTTRACVENAGHVALQESGAPRDRAGPQMALALAH